MDAKRIKKHLDLHSRIQKSTLFLPLIKPVLLNRFLKHCGQSIFYVRYFVKPRIDNYLRITIGTREEMEQLIRFLKDYLT